MNKKDVCKLKAGTCVELLWNDAPPSVAMLLEKPREVTGDVSLLCFHVGDREIPGYMNRRPVHTQVSRVLGEITFPSALSLPDVRLTK